MKYLKGIFTLGLILSLLNLYFPATLYAGQRYLLSKADITIYEPEMISTEPEVISKPKEKKKTPLWVWILGLAVVGGAAAAVAGGGGGGDDGGSSGGEEPGTIYVNW